LRAETNYLFALIAAALLIGLTNQPEFSAAANVMPSQLDWNLTKKILPYRKKDRAILFYPCQCG